jgi:ATP-binding cassette subfamily F protein uup
LLVSHDRDFLDRVVTSVIVSEGRGRWREYAGGYSDMVTQRGAGVEKKALEKPRRTKEPTGSRATAAIPAARRKLSFKDEHALKALPARIEKLQSEIAKLQAALADPALYARDRAGFDKVAAGLHEREAALAAAEHEWLELELKREEIEGA